MSSTSSSGSFDVEKFIECVKCKRSLWDRSSEEYTINRQCRDVAWHEIGEIMYENWLDYGFSERADKVREMKGKWRHLRDNFIKFMRYKERTGDASRKYCYANALNFILHSYRFTRNSDEEEDAANTNTNSEPETLTTTPTPKLKNGNPLSTPQTDNEPIQNVKVKRRKLNQNSTVPASSHVPAASSTPPALTFGRKSIESLNNCSNSSFNKTNSEEADKSFLLSLLPDFTSLNDDEKLDFKLTILHFLKNVRRK